MPTFNARMAVFAAFIAPALFLGACASTPPPMSKEDMLTAAGFHTKLADTPDKMAELMKLPPLKITKREKNGTVIAFYADPKGCKCLFYGNAAALQAYRQEAFAQHIADEDVAASTEANEAAMMNQNAAMWDGFGWGPWGGEAAFGPW